MFQIKMIFIEENVMLTVLLRQQMIRNQAFRDSFCFMWSDPDYSSKLRQYNIKNVDNAKMKRSIEKKVQECEAHTPRVTSKMVSFSIQNFTYCVVSNTWTRDLMST